MRTYDQTGLGKAAGDGWSEGKKEKDDKELKKLQKDRLYGQALTGMGSGGIGPGGTPTVGQANGMYGNQNPFRFNGGMGGQ